MDIVRLSPYIITGSQSVIHKQDEDPFLQQCQVVGKCLQGLCFGHTDAPTQHGRVALIRGIPMPRRGNAPPRLEIPVRIDSSPPMWSQYQSRYHTPYPQGHSYADIPLYTTKALPYFFVQFSRYKTTEHNGSCAGLRIQLHTKHLVVGKFAISTKVQYSVAPTLHLHGLVTVLPQRAKLH